MNYGDTLSMYSEKLFFLSALGLFTHREFYLLKYR